MDFLLDPNIAYLTLLVGVLLGLLAIVTPGTGLLEVGAFFCFALAGYAIYNLPFNFWAMIVMGLSVVPFIFAVRQPKRGFLLILSLLGFVVGSVFLFSQENGLPAVNLFLALFASSAITGFLWIVIGKSIQVMLSRPSHDLGALIGLVGEARSDIHSEGSVQVNGEMWSAESKELIPAGSKVRVLGRNGFVLVVEKH